MKPRYYKIAAFNSRRSKIMLGNAVCRNHRNALETVTKTLKHLKIDNEGWEVIIIEESLFNHLITLLPKINSITTAAIKWQFTGKDGGWRLA